MDGDIVKQQYPPIAIVGVGALFPGSVGSFKFWRNIIEGRDLITDVPETRWLISDYYEPNYNLLHPPRDKTYCKRGGFLPEVPFDCMAYGILPKWLEDTDSSQLLALIVTDWLLSDMGERFGQIERKRISCILGVTGATELLGTLAGGLQRPIWVKVMREQGFTEDEIERFVDHAAKNYPPGSEATFPGLLNNVVSGRVANRFDLGGTNCTVDAACATSLAALSMAAHELYLDEADLSIVGGVEAAMDIGMFMCFTKTPAMSLKKGDCAPFDNDADGTILGEGLALFALRRLADAERDGNPIYAVIRGIGSSSDGSGTAIYAPKPSGQALAMERAYERAGVSPASVELIEAHGTGTKPGDASEFEALRTVFTKADPNRKGWCALGSIKSQIGHTKGAAGAASMFKAMMALHHKVLPPTIKVQKPNESMKIHESPLYLNTKSRPWVHRPGEPRRAGVSAFGFGGTNFHVVLEEYAGSLRKPRFLAPASDLVLLHADSAEQLRKEAARILEVSRDEEGFSFAARQSLLSFKASSPFRLALMAQDGAELKASLEQALKMIEAAPEAAQISPKGWFYGVGQPPGPVAYLFSGQGSQYLDMGAGVTMAFEGARRIWDEAARFVWDDGLSLHHVVFPPPAFSDAERAAQEERLTRTDWAQPAIGAVSLSQLALLEQLGLEPACMAGHSFGELTALTAAGVLTPEALLQAARRRGELMHEASGGDGGMSAVSIDPDELERLLTEWGCSVVVANRNSSKQAVLSGRLAGLAQAEAKLKEAKIDFRRLPVSTAFHSEVVAAATVPFADFLEGLSFSSPRLPVYSNTFASPYPSDPKAIRATLAGQLAKPVRFRESIEAMYKAGARVFLEVGPGHVLTGLTRDCLGSRPHAALALDQKGQDGLRRFLQVLGQLSVLGIPLKFERLLEGAAMPPDPSAKKPMRLPVMISGANYGLRYPPKGGAAALPKPNPPRQGDSLFGNGSAPKEGQPAATEVPQGAADQGQGSLYYKDKPPMALAAGQGVKPALPVQVRTLPYGAQQRISGNEGARVSMATPEQGTQRTAAQIEPMPQEENRPRPSVPGQEILPHGPGGFEVQNVSNWVQALASIQDQTAETHKMFLHVAERSLANLEAALLGRRVPYSGYDEGKPGTAPSRMRPAVPLQAAPVQSAGYEAPSQYFAEGEKKEERAYGIAAPGQDALQLASAPAVQSQAAGQAGLSVSGIGAHLQPGAKTGLAELLSKYSREDLEHMMLEIVSEKTGYPLEMLELDMDMENDLGIDSIKRVEILAAVEEKVGELPDVDPAEFTGVRTLRDVAGLIERFASQLASGALAASSPATESTDITVHGADNAALEVADAGSGLMRYVFEPQPKGLSCFALPGILDAKPVYVCGPEELAGALCKALAGWRVSAQAVSTEDVPLDAPVVVCLEGLTLCETVDDAQATSRRGFLLAARLAKRFEADGGSLVFVQDTGGDFGHSNSGLPWLGGFSSLAKTCSYEWAKAYVRAIDVERSEKCSKDIAEALAAELVRGGTEVEVGLKASGQRLVLTPVSRNAQGGALQITSGDVIVATGGGRGVTAASLIELARQARPKIALLGRTPLEEEPAWAKGISGDAALKQALLAEFKAKGQTITPADLGKEVARLQAMREIRATLEAMKASGSETTYVACDVTDAAQLEGALQKVRSAFGPITGLVHGAGVLADKRLTDKRPEHFAKVFGTKVMGLENLLKATMDDPLAFIALFSSVVGRFGNIGQSDYGMANEVLNLVALAEAKKRPGCLVKSIGWGAWDSGMVGPALKREFEKRGLVLIKPDQGAKAFVHELLHGAPSEAEVVVSGPISVAGILALLERPAIERRFDILVGAQTHPYLDGHRIQGKVVLPFMIVCEWFLRCARMASPERRTDAFVLQNVRLLKGAILERFDRESLRLKVVVGPMQNDRARLVLSDDFGKEYYSAEVVAGDFSFGQVSHLAASINGAVDGEGLYGSVLFHGKSFGAIESIKISPDGATATLRGLKMLQWPEEDWQSDPLLLDGLLQMTWMWSLEHLGNNGVLPVAIGTLCWAGAIPQGQVKAVGRSQTIGKMGIRCTWWLLGEDGKALAELRDGEGYVISSDWRGAPNAAKPGAVPHEQGEE
jgi:acyl transferase domain-containing protein/NAD(P)-dependent dehydrogenase (short-subunit alcohol dehydrogenase family)